MRPPYSTEFIRTKLPLFLSFADYVVPVGYKAVVKNVTFTDRTAVPGQGYGILYEPLGNVVIVGALVPLSTTQNFTELHAVFLAGETLRVINFAARILDVHVGGFLLTTV